jgi:hypothetical protein
MRLSDEHRELLARVRPVDVPETPCTACVASASGNEVKHSADCAVSINIESVCDRDREWFAARLSTDFFYRQISWGEAAELVMVASNKLASLPPHSRIRAEGRVRVERVKDGVRIRRFDDVYFVLKP